MVNQARKAFVRGVYFLCFTLLAVSCSTQKSDTSSPYLAVAQGFLQDGQYPQCIGTADLVLKENPDSLAAMNLQGLCLMGIGRYSEAEPLLVKSCASTNDPNCYNQLAALYLKLENPTKSEEYAKKALSISSYMTPELAWANLALASLQRKDLKAAQGAIERALELNASNCDIRFLAARIFNRRGLPELALRQSEESITLCPMIDLSYFWKAYSLYKLGSRKESFATYKFIVHQFKRGEIVEQSKVNLDLLQNRIPIPEPRL